MKKLLSVIILHIIAVSAQPSIDSVMTVYSNRHDSEAIRKLADLCWEYRSIYPRNSIEYGEKALALMTKSSDNRYKTEVLNYLGVIYGNLGKLDSAYTYYRRAINISRENNDYNQIAYSLNNLGDYYFKNALYSTSLEYTIEAYNIFERLNNKQGMAYCLNDLGEIYLVRKDYPKALDNFRRSAELRLERKDTRGYAKSLINMARVYENQAEYEKAFDAFDRALEASIASDYIKGKSWILAGIADLYLKQEKYYYALEKSHKALEIDLNIGNKYGEIINYNRLGVIAMKLNNLGEAQQYLEKAKLESDKSGHIDQLMDAYKYLTDLFVLRADFQSAYASLREYERLNERIFSQQTSNKIADLQTAFITERKDRENETLKKDIEYQKNTRNYLFLISILVIGVFVLIIMKYKSQRKANELLKELNASKDKFFSIISHDLKSPMGAVSNLADILKTDYDTLSDPERKEIVTSLAGASADIQNLLLNLLTWVNSQKGGMGLNKAVVNLKDLLSAVVKVNLLAAKNKKIDIENEATSDLEIVADRYILETISGNFINNAIKFSYPDSIIKVRGYREDKHVVISVTDYGTGISQTALKNLLEADTKISTPGTEDEKGTGLGLKICKEFAAIHNGRMEVKSEPGHGSTFKFIFPEEPV
jgi:signal transduction histidine kinase